jgi:hypothetical protein
MAYVDELYRILNVFNSNDYVCIEAVVLQNQFSTLVLCYTSLFDLISLFKKHIKHFLDCDDILD